MPQRVSIMITLNRSSKPFLKTSAARALPTTWRIKTIACMVIKKLAAVIEKTKNSWHGDAVTGISFNPIYNEWATASIDGHARVFRYPAFKTKAKPRGNPAGGLQVRG